MRLMCFSVFDSKAAIYGTPFFMPREAMAIRDFADAVNNPKTTIAMHPSDYTLFHIGDYDDELGQLIPCNVRPLATAASLVQAPRMMGDVPVTVS